MRNRIKFAAVAGVATLALSAQSAWAAAATGTLTVTASVTSVCTVSDATLAFGDYNPTVAKDATATVNVQCTKDTAYTLYSATVSAERIMTSANASSSLNYELYTDTGRTTIFSTGGTSVGGITGSGTGLAQSNTIYGRIAANQAAAVATDYTHSANLTISY